MASIVSVQNYTVEIGPITAVGFLFVMEPFKESFTHGTLAVDDLVHVAFSALVNGGPVCVKVLGQVFCIKFDALNQEFVGRLDNADSDKHAPTEWTRIVRLG